MKVVVCRRKNNAFHSLCTDSSLSVSSRRLVANNIRSRSAFKKKKKERENLSMQQIIADLIHIYMNMYKFKFFEKKKLIYLPQIFVLFDDDYYHGLNYNYFASEG